MVTLTLGPHGHRVPLALWASGVAGASLSVGLHSWPPMASSVVSRFHSTLPRPSLCSRMVHSLLALRASSVSTRACSRMGIHSWPSGHRVSYPNPPPLLPLARLACIHTQPGPLGRAQTPSSRSTLALIGNSLVRCRLNFGHRLPLGVDHPDIYRAHPTLRSSNAPRHDPRRWGRCGRDFGSRGRRPAHSGRRSW